MKMSKAKQTLLTIFSFLLAPLFSISLILLYLYRRIIDIVLRVQLKDEYIGLLNGPDSIWAIEKSSSLSIINILLILEKDARHSNVNFLENVRRLVKERIVESPFEKLRLQRRKKFGYYYWQKTDEIDIDERVRWLEYERTNCDGNCDNIYNGHLKRILWNVCNQPLPGHSSSWEILVGRCCPRSSSHYLRRMEERLKSGNIRIPILFRVHHTIGDGVSLLKIFQDSIVDRSPMQETYLGMDDMSFTIKKEVEFETITVIVPQVKNLRTVLEEEDNLRYFCRKTLLSASMPFIDLVLFWNIAQLLQTFVDACSKRFKRLTVEDVKKAAKTFAMKEWNDLRKFFLENVAQKAKKFIEFVAIVVSAPVCLIEQTLRSMDCSVLHGPALSGEKMVSYWLEDDFKNSYDQKLFAKIESIKNIAKAKFGDVLLAALSVSLHKHFLRVNENAPEKLNVILPAKIGKRDEKLPLQNHFTVGVLPICISRIKERTSLDPSEDSQVLDRLEDIKIASERLRRSFDHSVNLMVIKHLSAILPESFLRLIFESHSTMVVSNVAGPQEVRILGHSLKNIAFWAPNRSYTGISFSLLTYRGYLHLSLMADKVLIQDEKLLTEILENTVQEIDDLYDRLTLSLLSKRLLENVSTPTKTGFIFRNRRVVKNGGKSFAITFYTTMILCPINNFLILPLNVKENIIYVKLKRTLIKRLHRNFELQTIEEPEKPGARLKCLFFILILHILILYTSKYLRKNTSSS